MKTEGLGDALKEAMRRKEEPTVLNPGATRTAEQSPSLFKRGLHRKHGPQGRARYWLEQECGGLCRGFL